MVFITFFLIDFHKLNGSTFILLKLLDLNQYLASKVED